MALQVPSALAPAVRAAFVAQGYPDTVVADDGTIDPFAVLSGVYDTVEFRSRLTPPVKVSIAGIGGPPSGFSQLVQPSVTVTGRAGKVDIAPFGVPSALVGWSASIGIFAAVFGFGYLLGRSGKRTARA